MKAKKAKYESDRAGGRRIQDARSNWRGESDCYQCGSDDSRPLDATTRRCRRCGVEFAIGIAFVFVVALFSTAQAVAQVVEETPTDHAARVAFASGDLAFGEGRYDDALDDFTRAHDLSHRPELLYNIGLAADRLRRDEAAIRAFQGYLDALPEAENRSEVQGRLRALRAAVEAEAEVETDLEAFVIDETIMPAVPVMPAQRPIYEEWWLWTIIGCVVTAAIVIPVGIVAGSHTETEPFVTGDIGPGGIVIALEGP